MTIASISTLITSIWIFILKTNSKKSRQSFTSKKNMHMINNFHVKILINIDIICSKKITINLKTRKLIIDNCNITIFITCTFVDFKINRIDKFHYIVIISTYSIMTISFKTQNVELSNKKNYFFQSHVISLDFKTKNNIMTYIINVKTFVMHVLNVTNKSIIVLNILNLTKFSISRKKIVITSIRRTFIW